MAKCDYRGCGGRLRGTEQKTPAELLRSARAGQSELHRLFSGRALKKNKQVFRRRINIGAAGVDIKACKCSLVGVQYKSMNQRNFTPAATLLVWICGFSPRPRLKNHLHEQCVVLLLNHQQSAHNTFVYPEACTDFKKKSAAVVCSEF